MVKKSPNKQVGSKFQRHLTKRTFMIQKYLIAILFFAFSFYHSASQNNKLTFITNCNDRYGFCVDYPKNILYPQPLSGNGDGRHFSNKKGDKILTTFGRRNDTGDDKISLAEQFEEDLRSEDLVDEITGVGKKVITYSKLSNNYFVISGFYKGHISLLVGVPPTNVFIF
jgi:hypothetical protein